MGRGSPGRLRRLINEVRVVDARVDDQAQQAVVEEIARESGRRRGWSLAYRDYWENAQLHEYVSAGFSFRSPAPTPGLYAYIWPQPRNLGGRPRRRTTGSGRTAAGRRDTFTTQAHGSASRRTGARSTAPNGLPYLGTYDRLDVHQYLACTSEDVITLWRPKS